MPKRKPNQDIANFGQTMYVRNFNADFTVEMSRSARLILQQWLS